MMWSRSRSPPWLRFMGLKRSSIRFTREERYSLPMISWTLRSMAWGDDWIRSVHWWSTARYSSSDFTFPGRAETSSRNSQ